MDSTATLQKIFANKKCSGARTKCESIVTKVYAPWAQEELKNDLKCVNFVTISYDTSNHMHVRQVTILVRYFQVYDLENRLKNKLLALLEISVETADTIFMQVMKANFGGVLRRCKENALKLISTNETET
jgi:hypothetical protein